MKKLISTAAAAGLAFAATAAQAEEPRLILQITVDQLRGDLPERFREHLGDGGAHVIRGHIESERNQPSQRRPESEESTKPIVVAIEALAILVADVPTAQNHRGVVARGDVVQQAGMNRHGGYMATDISLPLQFLL